uniref:Uncharacterized protein n=1 Tax=Arundo donax TaxID=35708 RepID=A0A0A8YLC7_ARUDO
MDCNGVRVCRKWKRSRRDASLR